MEDRIRDLEIDMSHVKRSQRDLEEDLEATRTQYKDDHDEIMRLWKKVSEDVGKFTSSIIAIKWAVFGGSIVATAVNYDDLGKLLKALITLIGA